jgi:hypothetical protein
VILSIGLLFATVLDGLDVLEWSVYVLAVMGFITTLQRIWHVRNAFQNA